MAIANYSDLQTSVKGWLQRASISFNSTDYIPDLIRMGELYIFRHARTRDMETSISSVISNGIVAIPADYVEMKHCYINSVPVTSLQRKSANYIYTAYPTRSAGSIPKFFATDNGNFIFGPFPDSTYTLNGTYYKRLTSISSSANALFTNNPDLYLFAALAECKSFQKDMDFIKLWENKRDQILMDVNGEDTRERFSGSPLTVVTA